MMDFSGTGLPLVPFLPASRSFWNATGGWPSLPSPARANQLWFPPSSLTSRGWAATPSSCSSRGDWPRWRWRPGLRSSWANRSGAARATGCAPRPRVGRETRIEVVTEALLTRRIQEDPLLDGVGLVILDEFHERSIHADLALALALEVRRARPDLALLAMSATLETEGVAALMGARTGEPSPSLHCPGTLHPVRTSYRPNEGPGGGRRRLPTESRGCSTRQRATSLPSSPVLVRSAWWGRVSPPRLAAARMSSPCTARCGWRNSGGSSSPTACGPAPFRFPRAAPRDPGDLHRRNEPHRARHHHGCRCRLVPAFAPPPADGPRPARDREGQRLLRGAAPGQGGSAGSGAVRALLARVREAPRPPDPEILRSDLSGLVLECALWGARTPGELSWMDEPPAAGWAQAWESLRMLGLVDASGPTSLGRTVAGLGLAPRLGVLVTRGAARGEAVLAAACAAILQERDGSGIVRDPDFRLRLELIRTGRGGGESWRRTVETEMGRILRRHRPAEGAAYGWTVEQEHGVGALLAPAFPDRLARREPDGSYRLVTGRAARFPSAGPGSGARVAAASRAAGPWVVALDADPGETSGTIRLASPVDRETVDAVLALAAEESMEIRWEGLVPRAFIVRRSGRLVLTERPGAASAQQAAESFRLLLSKKGLGILPWNRQSTRLLARMRIFARAYPDAGLGGLSEEELVAGQRRLACPVPEAHRRPGPGLLGAPCGTARDARQPEGEAPGRGAGKHRPADRRQARGGIRRCGTGGGGAHSGGVRSGGEPPGLRHAAHLPAPLPFPAAASDHTRPCKLLADHLRGCAQGDAGEIPQALLAGESP